MTFWSKHKEYLCLQIIQAWSRMNVVSINLHPLKRIDLQTTKIYEIFVSGNLVLINMAIDMCQASSLNSAWNEDLGASFGVGISIGNSAIISKFQWLWLFDLDSTYFSIHIPVLSSIPNRIELLFINRFDDSIKMSENIIDPFILSWIFIPDHYRTTFDVCVTICIRSWP